ncbi:MAG: alpha/beta hydrolase [Myxococcaceae bacterium]
MVLRGQFLERPTLVPVGKVVLEGLWHRGRRAPALLLIPPLPSEGGGMDHLLLAELAWACATAGYPTLRFNFRGVGASQGTRGEGLEDDAFAASCLLRDNVGGGAVAAAAVGGSFEVAVGLCRRVSLAGLCLLGPPSHTRLPPEPPSRVIDLAGDRLARGLPQVGKEVVQWLEMLAGEAESH